MKIVVKIGTQSLLSDQGLPRQSVLRSLVAQLAALQKQGHQVVFVSSGAVGFGRSIARQRLGRTYGHHIGEKQVLASLGQPELMHVYAGLFKEHNLLASQLLLTKQDFHTRKHYLNISRLINEILSHKHIIPILNENDSVAIEELMFTDNDELAGLIAAQMNAEKLIILSNVAGVYTGHPEDPMAALIPLIDPAKGWPDVSSAKSAQGRGGMISKLSTARKMSNFGITTHIASMNEPCVLKRLVEGEPLGTTVLPAKRKSSLKRWIAYHQTQTDGTILLNDCLYRILTENKRVVSILPVGLAECHGDFKKGDVVALLAPDRRPMGMGIARYEGESLKKYLGQKNKPVFIHYDHLYIF